MHQGLYESLTGRFADGTPVESVSAEQRRIRSIIDHLARLFNTRDGSLGHLPGYGLPDMSAINRGTLEGIESLRAAVARTVERYEPRLTEVKVLHADNNTHDGRLVFVLTARIKGIGVVRFQTTFTSTGGSSIAPWRRPE
ncbi:MAG: type VI secretion system baseplate subunit TssE [Chitinivibrionales bacterium]|nr:type VI secretion system baseplate subunit TssE [Chitinivibrionales bacterium]